MARKKRSGALIEKAVLRANLLKAIDENLDLGNGNTLEMFINTIEKAKASLSRYNTLLSTVDEMKNEIERNKKELAEVYSRMLLGVAVKYGKNSDEYEMAGGVRKDERKRPIRKPKTDAPK